MGALKDIVYDILDEIRAGELSYAEIAERYDVPLETVEDILNDMIENEEDYDGQPTEQEEWYSFDPDC